MPISWFVDKLGSRDVLGTNGLKRLASPGSSGLLSGVHGGSSSSTSTQGDTASNTNTRSSINNNNNNGNNEEGASEEANPLTLRSWFEIFPCPADTRWNREGQYRPVQGGIPQSTGYGLIRPKEPIGFMKVQVEVELVEPLALSLARNPWYVYHTNPFQVPSLSLLLHITLRPGHVRFIVTMCIANLRTSLLTCLIFFASPLQKNKKVPRPTAAAPIHRRG